MLAFATFQALSYTVGVCGAQGRLGREIVKQSLDRGWNVNAVVRRVDDPIFSPDRAGWLTQQEGESTMPLFSHRLKMIDSETDHSWVSDCDAIVFAMSGKPFAPDSNTTELVRSVCASAESDQRLCLVSAHGVGDSIENSNVGIRAMRAFYLKATYEAKQRQEELMDASVATTLVLRPKVLSFSNIPLNTDATPRFRLATVILDWMAPV